MINGMLDFLWSCFPVKSRKILFISHLGKGYGCNPKYICEYILQNHHDEFDLHWLYDPTCSDTNNIPKGVIPVNLYSWQFRYDILTCGVLISNTRLPNWFHYKKRKGQRYIQTWHSSLRLKRIEGDAHLNETYESIAKEDSRKTSVIVSGCRFSSEIYKRAFWYNGPLLEVGTPRVDFLINQHISKRKSLCVKAKLNSQVHYVLYAPTFRKGGAMDAYNIDYKRLTETLTTRYGGQWKVLSKLHPNLLGKVSFQSLGEHCIDVTWYDDIQELLIIADMLITDFSSCMFDMAYLKKSCILYASDYEQYVRTERDLYFDIRELPFPLAVNNEELNDVINGLDATNYLENIKSFLSKIGSFESGKACEKIYNYIKQS